MKKPSRSFKAKSLKTFALSWLRFNLNYDTVCSEDPHRNADAIGTNTEEDCKKMTEIEVKVDMADLKADINKDTGRDGLALTKHEAMANIGDQDNKRTTLQPSQFYFLVPTEMLEKAREYIHEKHPHAGILHANPVELVGFNSNPIVLDKTAKVLHKLLISKVIKRAILMRSSSELCRALIKMHAADVEKLTKTSTQDEAPSQNETVKPE